MSKLTGTQDGGLALQPDRGSTRLLPAIRAGAVGGLAVEIWMVMLFSVIWLLGIAVWELPVNFPDHGSIRFVRKHYFAPLGLAFMLQLPVFFLARRQHRATDPWMMVKQLPFIVLVVFLHFNFKAWMPLVNPRLFDGVYQGIDQFCAPVLSAIAGVRHFVAEVSPYNVDHWYHALFVGMFFVSVAAHAIFDTPQRQRQLLLGLNLILLVGGLLYWLAPAIGPFIYEQGPNALGTRSQMRMLSMFHDVSNTGQIPGGYFVACLAAMPSLHVAHALFMTMFAARSLRWLFYIYLPVSGWILIESVTAKWHYLIDLPMGAALALICLRIVPRLVNDPAPK